MNREEITNSQDYKATKIALDWWYSLPNEERRDVEVNAEPDIIDAYSDGVLYGWNNPNWISVEDRLPKEKQKVLVYMPADERCDHEYICEALYNYAWHGWEDADEPIELEGITHWMPLPQPPRKEDKK